MKFQRTLLFVVAILFVGCPSTNDLIRKERLKVTEAVNKMGGGGKSFIVFHDNGKAYNKIELNFRDRQKINNEALQHLAGLSGIVGVDFSGTNITDEGLAVLLSLPDLEYVQLSNTSVSDTGLMLLKGCQGLKRLDVRHTDISAKAAEILSEFSRLEIVFAKGTSLDASDLVNTDQELLPFFKRIE